MIADILYKIIGGDSAGDWMRFNSYSLPLMKQRLNADFVNASADEIIFIFSRPGKNHHHRHWLNGCHTVFYQIRLTMMDIRL
jgi:hypothetical protein